MFAQHWMLKTRRKLKSNRLDESTLVISKDREPYALDAALYLFLAASVYALLLGRFGGLDGLLNWVSSIPSSPRLWPVLFLPVIVLIPVPRCLKVAILGEQLVFDRRKSLVIESDQRLAELEAIEGVEVRQGVICRKYRRNKRYQLELALRDGTMIWVENNLSEKSLAIADEIAEFVGVPLVRE